MTFSSRSGRAGTVRYQAPELLKNERPNHFGSDIYAFACVCYEVRQRTRRFVLLKLPLQILTGKLPFFESLNEAGVIYKVTVEGARPSRVEAISLDLWLLLSDSWHEDADQRPEAATILLRLLSDPIGQEIRESPADWDDTYSARFRRSVQEWPLLPSIAEIERRIQSDTINVDDNALLTFGSLNLVGNNLASHFRAHAHANQDQTTTPPEAIGNVANSRGSRLGSVGASGISAAMSRMDTLSLNEALQAQRCSRMNTPHLNSTGANGIEGLLQQQMERTTSPDSEDYEDEMVQPTPTNPTTLDIGLTGSPDAWNMTGGDPRAGLEVHTIGHLMPPVNTYCKWPFDGNASTGEMVGKRETLYSSTSSGADSIGIPSPEKQTLRVRRWTFVPGWVVPPRVLLVDDDAVIRKLSSKFLQVFGCIIDVAVDGVGAVNKMNLEKYDLVLMVCTHNFLFCLLS